MDRNKKLYLLYRILTVEGFASAIYMPWMLVEHHFPTPTVAGLMVLGDLTLLLMQVPTGWLADRYGRKVSLVLGSLAQIIGTLLFWYTTSPGWLVAGSFVAIAAGDAFRSGAQEALLYESCKPGEYGRLYASSQAWLLGVLAVLTLSGGVIVQTLGYHVLWAIETASAIAGLAVALAMVEPPRGETHHHPIDWRRVITACPWRLVLPATAAMVACGAASFTMKATTATLPPALLGAMVSVLPFVEMLGAAWALKLPFGLNGLAALSIAGLAATAVTPWAVVVPFLAAGAAPVLRSVALNRVARDSDRASLESVAGTFELVVAAAVRPLVGRALGSSHSAVGVAGVALLLGVLALLGHLRAPARPGNQSAGHPHEPSS